MNHLLRKKKLYLTCGAGLVVIIILLRLTWDPIGEVLVENEIVQQVITTVKDTLDKDPILFEYIQVNESCGPTYEGACVNVRSGTSIQSPVVFQARNGTVFKVQGKVTAENREWYKLSFDDEWLRYPERVEGDMYISEEYVTSFLDEGVKEITATTSETIKHIIVDRSEQTLYAYEGDTLFMKEKVSTGIELTPTPRGTFTIFKKTPSRYMQGPIPNISDHYYDLPGVPWNLYFTEEGAVIHGAYWHDSFGTPWSNGCVNMSIASAEKLYRWADLGTEVLVKD